MMMGDGYVSPTVYEDMEAAARAGAQKQLRRLAEQAKRSGIRARPILLEGIAHERIAQAARSRKADLGGNSLQRGFFMINAAFLLHKCSRR
jgi:nucleotide-binding universal stress UspA family protein